MSKILSLLPHWWRDLLVFANENTFSNISDFYMLKHVHARRQAYPQPLENHPIWISVPLSSFGMQTETRSIHIFNAPPPPSCKKTQHTPLIQPRHADTVNPLAIPDVHAEQQLLLFCMGNAFVVSFLLLCEVHGSCSSLNRADQFSEETQPLVVKSRDAHAFTYSWGQRERGRSLCVCVWLHVCAALSVAILCLCVMHVLCVYICLVCTQIYKYGTISEL